MRLPALAPLLLVAAVSGCAPKARVGGVGAAASFGTGLGQSTSIGGRTVTPLAIVEDSRCPADAMCIQAGTARVLVRVQRERRSTEAIVGLDRSANVGGAWLHLATLCPYPLASRPAVPADYRMVFVLSDAPEIPAAPIACPGR